MEPELKWYQITDKVIITVMIENVNFYTINIKNDSILYISVKTTNNTLFKKTIKLLHNIDVDQSTWKLNKKIILYLKKTDKTHWSNLTETKDTKIKTNWVYWNYIDDTDENYMFNSNSNCNLTINNKPSISSYNFIDDLYISESDSE